jgi:thiol:disulfide interchange protein DsbC
MNGANPMRMPLYICVLAITAVIATAANAQEGADKVRKALEARDPSLKVISLEKSPASGLYLVQIDGASGYVTADGRYLILGDMLDVSSRTNLTERARQGVRRSLLRTVDPNSAIVFAPAKSRYTITVFIDADCPYCRKLHADIAQLLQSGVTVRYLAFPRSGPDTDSWSKMEAVWCAADRRDALARATLGADIEKPKRCAGHEIADHYALGQKLGIPGTPMILSEDGTVLGGYLPPSQLLEQLQAHSEATAPAR